MENFILIDLETQNFFVESGIYEVAALVVRNWDVVDSFYLGIVEDESQIHMGYGIGYEDISRNTECIEKFKEFLDKYKYPLVAHNASFDRKFLVYYEWIGEDYPFYDSIRAIKYANSKLLSYSLAHLKDFVGIENPQKHTAMEDVELTLDVLKYFKPERWFPVGMKSKNSTSHSNSLTAIKEDFNVVTDLFLGKNIVFTGKGPYTRNQLMELAKKCGADITSNSITKKTNLLVVGEDAGSKLEKAQKLGIEIMSMDDFYGMIEGIKLDEKQQAKIKTLVEKEPELLSDKLAGECITPYPMSVAMSLKVSKLVERHGGKTVPRLRQKETTLLVYQPYAEDLATVEKARNLNIKTMSLGKFNRYLLELLEECEVK